MVSQGLSLSLLACRVDLMLLSWLEHPLIEVEGLYPSLFDSLLHFCWFLHDVVFKSIYCLLWTLQRTVVFIMHINMTLLFPARQTKDPEEDNRFFSPDSSNIW